MDAEVFLATAAAAEATIARPEVEAAWDAPSALEGYTVGALAGHLARAVFTVERYLAEPPGEGEPTDAAGYLVRALGSHDPVDSEFHANVRRRGAEEADSGAAELVSRLRDSRARLTAALADADAGRPVSVLAGIVVPLADYVGTRLLELVVHLDDLAVSLGDRAPTGVPETAYGDVAALLARVAVHRAGAVETVRSLARRERHPEAVRAL